MASARNSRSGRSARPVQAQRRAQEESKLQRPIPLRPVDRSANRPADRVPLEVARSAGAQSDVVQALPRSQATPSWLRLLLGLQRTSSALTFALVLGLLVVYGWTVYTQQRWGRAYSRMETLQKQERQLMAANEVIKNQMAKQAEVPDSGLVLPEPGNTIFLTPAPQRSPVTPEVNFPPPQPIPARPLGY
jgi:hypothetical protein